MPPCAEALVALPGAGTPAWRWRPREVDQQHRACGAVPHRFQLELDGTRRDVVGVGKKDGTYEVLDRAGGNVRPGGRWDDAQPVALPYGATQVVPGGAPGGIIATAALDVNAGRLSVSTAPGAVEPFTPPQPPVQALDKNTGAILWQNTLEAPADARCAPPSATPEVGFVGSLGDGALRAYDAVTGGKLASVRLGLAVASAAAIVDGIVVVGAGVGDRSMPGSPGDRAARIPQNITALCIPGGPSCQ